jgi:eukaryotic-like serine/threonine-protein kinase
MNIERRRLGKYELRERLASGGQGVVWKAFDTQLQRFVAIKQLNARLQEDPNSIARFEQEAQFVASLRHPNIVQIHDFQFVSTPDSNVSTAYMVMDYIEGPTLADYIRNTSRRGQFPSPSEIVSLFTSISLALDYAHQRGMVHRDIKPANIILDQRNANGKPMGEPILMDFGIAKLQGHAAEVTRALGTPIYASPEQAQGLSGDKSSDLYSLGIVLYEVMTGIPPFHGKPIQAILLQHSLGTPTSPDLINPRISPDVSAVILKSIAKDPDARFASASAMTIALAEALKVLVPPELRKTGTSPTSAVLPPAPNEPNAFNLLTQPSGKIGTNSTPPATSFTSSPLAFVPPTNDQQTPAMISSDSSAVVDVPPNMNNPLLPSLQIPSSPPSAPQPSGKRSKKRLSIVLIVLLAILGLGLASYALLAPKNTGGGVPVVVGQVHFLSSHNTVGDLDEVQITSQSIPDGQGYYAWLVTHNDDIPYVRWSFTVHNGRPDPSSYQQQNLLTPLPYRFLITHENGNPVVPSFKPSDRLYYAPLNKLDNNHLSFDIMQCPQSDSNDICMS